MADKKISALTGVTTPLAGTEVLPIVQSSSTKKVSVADLTAGRAVSAASLALTTPLVVTSGGTGTGTALTAGSVVFAGAAGVYSQDNTDLFYDSTNKTFGIGTNTPGYKLQVVGVSYFNGPKSDTVGAASNYLGSGGYWSVRTNTANDWCLDRYAGGSFNSLIVRASNGNLQITDGDLVIGTSGKGIDFSATGQATGMTSELLADYEEGNWTPSLTSAGGNFTTIAYGDQQGSYTKVGRMVTVRGNLFTTGAITAGSASGQVYIAGLPFAVAAGGFGTFWTNPDTANYNSPLALATGVTATASTLLLFKSGSVNNPAFAVTDLRTAGGPSNNISFQATYFV